MLLRCLFDLRYGCSTVKVIINNRIIIIIIVVVVAVVVVVGKKSKAIIMNIMFCIVLIT